MGLRGEERGAGGAVLFINACGRENSRTLRLCRHFLEGMEYDEVRVHELGLRPFDGAAVEERDRRLAAAEWDRFPLAGQFARASLVVVGAPYWDLSFPSALKVYVEHICVNGITFAYGPKGPYGKCDAGALCYLTTAGGALEGANFGGEYFRGLARFFGIPRFEQISAEGLDIVGAPVERILTGACERIDRVKATL